MLAVVITDTKISSASDLSSVKFYVLYFADYHYISWKDVDRKIIEKVIESDVFKSYMGA